MRQGLKNTVIVRPDTILIIFIPFAAKQQGLNPAVKSARGIIHDLKGEAQKNSTVQLYGLAEYNSLPSISFRRFSAVGCITLPPKNAHGIEHKKHTG